MKDERDLAQAIEFHRWKAKEENQLADWLEELKNNNTQAEIRKGTEAFLELLMGKPLPNEKKEKEEKETGLTLEDHIEKLTEALEKMEKNGSSGAMIMMSRQAVEGLLDRLEEVEAARHLLDTWASDDFHEFYHRMDSIFGED